MAKDVVFMTHSEFTAYRTTIDEKISDMQLTVYGRNPDYPIVLADLGTDVMAYINPAQYYLKGSLISAKDLPPNIVTMEYILPKIKGAVSAVWAYDAIDEVVAARETKASLLTNLGYYSKKADLITNINALGSGTINAARVTPPAHNDTTSRDATGCHPISAITDLTTTLSGKAPSATIIATINATSEPTLIEADHLAYKAHTHPQSDITNLVTDLSTITGAVSDLQTAVGSILTGGYATTDEYFDCLYSIIVAMAGLISYTLPACWKVRP